VERLSLADRVSRQQAQKKKAVGISCTLLELPIWLQAGEDRAIAAGSLAASGFKNGMSPPSRLQLQIADNSNGVGPVPEG
jgi:TRAP-type mannitol/chloroaromatic compound transport system permease large subunit